MPIQSRKNNRGSPDLIYGENVLFVRRFNMVVNGENASNVKY